MLNFGWILSAGAFSGLAVAVGSVLAAGGRVVVDDHVLILVIEVVFFASLAIFSVVRAFMWVYNKKNEATSENTVKSGRKKSK